MSQYTELLDIKAETLSPDDDEYEMNLLEVSALFRGFDEALTAFIEEHGFIGTPLVISTSGLVQIRNSLEKRHTKSALRLV